MPGSWTPVDAGGRTETRLKTIEGKGHTTEMLSFRVACLPLSPHVAAQCKLTDIRCVPLTSCATSLSNGRAGGLRGWITQVDMQVDSSTL